MRLKKFLCTCWLFSLGAVLIHMLVISIGRHLSRTLKKSTCPGRGPNRGPSIYCLALYHISLKAGLYRKAVQVYHIPNLYPVKFSPSMLLENDLFVVFLFLTGQPHTVNIILFPYRNGKGKDINILSFWVGRESSPCRGQ